ncbi:MAG: phosphatidylglycerophosphatase A family protein [Desulfomonilia bacterium]
MNGSPFLAIISRTIASFFGAGYSPVAPGTVGTLATVPLYLLIRRWSLGAYVIFLTILVGIGIVVSGVMEQAWGKDPSRVVIDEVCGLLIALIRRPARWTDILLAILLFRAFDILKPPPIGILDREIHGGLGIMADDLAAGAVSALILALATWKRRIS